MFKIKSLKPISKNQLQRLPFYLNYLKDKKQEGVVFMSAPKMAIDLNLNEEQVKKDLALISTIPGKPKSGRNINDLIDDIEKYLGYDNVSSAVIVGVGHLGRALLNYKGFEMAGLDILAGFDVDEKIIGTTINGKKIFPLEKIKNLLPRLNAHIGIITVPAIYAQEVADQLIKYGCLAIWNFAPIHLNVPENIVVQNENMVSSLAVLSKRLEEKMQKNK